jgi:hypothetical protein
MPHELDNLARALCQEQDARDTRDAAQLIKQPSHLIKPETVRAFIEKQFADAQAARKAAAGEMAS